MTVLLERSPVPLYHQLKELLTEKIESGEWTQGYRLPGEHQLSAEFGVSRPTVRQAMQLLENQGLIERRRGKGTFVARPKFAHNLLSRGVGTSENTPIKFRLHSLRKRAMPVNIAGHLGLTAGDQAWELRRSILAGEEPIMLILSWLPIEMFPTLDDHDPGRQAMQHILREHYGVYTARQHKEVEVTTLDEEEARLLEANLGAPALLMTYLNFTPRGLPYEYRKMIVRGDRSKYYVDVDFPEMLM